MDLGRDAFTVTYDPGRLDVSAIMLRIRGLGFKPEEAAESRSGPSLAASDRHAVPEPVAEALARARTTNALTLVEFYAAWCGPCKVLESRVLGDPRVLEALERFEFVKVDTDRQVEPSDYFRVVGLPTLVVLDSAGKEIFRREGMIEAEELAQTLNDLAGDHP
jgi:thiol:disulfide interchange protein